MQFREVPLNRYPHPPTSVFSNLDMLTDLRSWLEFLTATDYVVEVLATHHGLSAIEARTRAKSIIPHVRLAGGYIDQSLDGPSRLAFLPIYYALLNLMKVYILTGPRHADLQRHRHHGMGFDPSKASHSVLTETVRLRTSGAFPLFYETLTGVRFRGPKTLRMAEVYPYVGDIESEYEMAVGRPNRLAQVKISSQVTGSRLEPTAHFLGSHTPKSAAEVKVLASPQRHPKDPKIYRGKAVTLRGRSPEEALRGEVRWCLLYSSSAQVVRTPLCSKQFLLAEEIPIVLLFFHMSSIVRYKPEFFERLQTSKYWPVLAVARRHCLLRFLLLFWAHMHQRLTVFEGTP